MILILIINVEPAHRHHAEPVPGPIRRVQPLEPLLLRVLDDRELGIRPGAGSAGRGHGGRDPDQSKPADGDDEPALDLPLPRCLFPSLYIYIYIYILIIGFFLRECFPQHL